MARGKLFESWTFRQSLPAPFDEPGCAGQKDYGLSKYNCAGSVQKSSLHAPTLRALLAYAKLVSAAQRGESTDGLGAAGHQDATYRISEYRSGDKTDCVVFVPNTGKFIAGRFTDGSDHPCPYTVGPGAASGSTLLFALMPVFEEDAEFADRFAEFRRQMEDGWPDPGAALETALTLCDNVYRRIENARGLGEAAVKLQIPPTGNVTTLSKLAIDNGSYAPTGTLYGQFTILEPENGVSGAPKLICRESFAGRYTLGNRTLTEREEAMVPKLPDWYVIPPEVVRVCEHAQQTTGAGQPMRNFLLRGEAGTGKTMDAQAIAAGLHLPYLMMTCSANTEIADLIGQFIPVPDEDAGSGVPETGDLPGVSDIVMHPPSVYMALTGVYDEGKTEDDVLRKLVEIAARRMTSEERGRGQRIRYVDTPLIEAIRYGYCIELQEPACIANPGVLVGLNSLLDSCQAVTLPTGERVERHPDTVIVVTTNTDYAGTRDMNQSVLSRMDLICDVPTPDLLTMVRRVMNVTGCTDEQETTKMAVVVRNIAERCRKNMITDGCCGMRELKAWVTSAMITKDPYESALHTVISSASADPDSRADLITTCLEPQYARPF